MGRPPLACALLLATAAPLLPRGARALQQQRGGGGGGAGGGLDLRGRRSSPLPPAHEGQEPLDLPPEASWSEPYWLEPMCAIFEASWNAAYTPEERQAKAHCESLTCGAEDVRALREEAAAMPGVIVTGQGGSATRAVQEMVQLAGTHDFGLVDPMTRDTWAVRWSGVNECPGPPPQVLVGKTGREIAEVGEVSLQLRLQKVSQVCRSLMCVRDERQSRVPRPWAMKEPNLRHLVPFFDEVLGRDGYRIVHVTRDVRSIGNMHDDWALAKNLGLEEDRVDAMMGQLRENGVVAAAAKAPGWSESEVRRRIMFAYVWAMTEAKMKKHLEAERPDQYFHLSELELSAPDGGRGVLTRLAKFLGVASPTREHISLMAGVWQAHTDPERWSIMDAVVHLDGLDATREALSSLGYRV